MSLEDIDHFEYMWTKKVKYSNVCNIMS